MSKTCVKQPLSKIPKVGFQDQLECSILLTFINLPFVIEIFVLSIFEWPFYTGFTVVTLRIYVTSTKITGMVNVLKFRTLFSFFYK